MQAQFIEREARKHAEAANLMKDEFLSILSHELRTPLNAISGWVHLLRNRERDEATMDQGLETIERNVRAQVSLIEDLLDISRIASGKIHLDVRPVELAQVVKDAVEAVRLEVETEAHPPGAAARPRDGHGPRRCESVAADRAEPPWQQLEVHGERRAGRGQTAAEGPACRDRGQRHGHRDEPQVPVEHFFEPFRTADASLSRRHGGLGLGLSIVKRLTELQGGTVRADSPGEGKGATFTVTLPLMFLPPEPGEVRRGPALVDRPIGEKGSIEGVRVLFVDDEADARNVVGLLLRDAGAEVMAVATAAEALEELLRSRPAILVADLAMPEEDGYALIRKVRALEPERGGRTPAIALTAFAGVEYAAKALEAGFQKHLGKPVVSHELIAAIAALTEGSKNPA